MIKLSTTSEKRPRQHAWLWVVLLPVLVIFAALLAERWRGRWALNRWKQRMAAKGEAYQASQIWPQPTPQGRAFSNQLNEVMAQLPPGLERYAGRMSAIVLQEPGLSRRGSQEPNPAMLYQSNGTNRQEEGTWAGLAQLIGQAQPPLQSLRAILRNPPADTGRELSSAVDGTGIPNWNFVGARKGAQALQAAVLLDLNRGDLEGAKENLVALAGFTKIYSADPTLVNYMVRIAILGLSVETAWDALQAEGWTDAQLAELQQAFQHDELLAQMPRTLEAERAIQLCELDWFSSHSYLAWVSRYQSLYESLGYQVPVSTQVRAIRYWREWMFHPLWRLAWANQEKLYYAQHMQREVEVLRDAVRSGSGCELDRRLKSLRGTYNPPAASWRFYLAIPLSGQMSEKIGGSILSHECPYPDFRRAADTSMKNLTLAQMLTAAIAMKRYQLRQGKPPPASLEALVPDFMARLPRDLMDGQPLRYEVNDDGSYRLYSVADDGNDDGGDPVPADDTPRPSSPWNGRDWLWPALAH